ncbi:MAG: hypothetical protein ABL908_12370 [Hyphomicrobium sp.]
MQQRFHVFVAGKRTTVCLDNILSDLLALKLGSVPRSPDGSATVRVWLQQQIDGMPERWWRHRQARRKSMRVSQWASEAAIKAVADPLLIDGHRAWFVEAG